MISYLNDSDFFTLLGLDKLSEEDKARYEDEVLATLINSVLSRILEDQSITEDRKKVLKDFLEGTDINSENFDSVMDQFPESDKFIDQEIYILKKEMIREMIVDVLAISEVTPDEKSKLNEFSNSLDSDLDFPGAPDAMQIIFKYLK